jgi:hypothetical protein
MEGTLRGRPSFIGDSRRYVKDGSANEHLFP